MNDALRHVLVVVLLSVAAFGQSTHSWEQSRFEEFEKGTPRGVSIRSDGGLELAPAFRQVGTTRSTYLWSAASDAAGNLYAAGGAPARVYRVSPKGEVALIFAGPELQAQAVAVGRDGAVYVATSPDGRVYRVTHNPGAAIAVPPPLANGSAAAPLPPATPGSAAAEKPDPSYNSEVYFEPKTKYIWALALDPQGRLYVATGDRGQIFRVDRAGSGSQFFKSEDAHIRSLAFDRQGNLIAGSDGSGLVYRINASGQGFVLFGASKKEITALAVDSRGNIYAAAAGERRPAMPVMPPAAAPAAPAAPAAGAPAGAPAPPAARPATPPGTSVPSTTALPLPGMGAAGSEIDRIAADGSPKRIWASRDELVYSLAFDSQGRLLAGTGNRGRVFAIEDEGAFADLLKASANQVTAFAPSPSGGLYAVTSNLGKVFLLENNVSREGSYDSDVFDAKIFSRWGRAEVRSRGEVELWARSGNVDNPDRNWSPWKRIDLKGTAESGLPAARYAQWRAVLHSPGNAKAGERAASAVPRLYSVRFNFLPKNVAPEVDDVLVAVGTRVSAGPAPAAPPGAPAPAGTPVNRGAVAIRWSAHDDNGDQLLYSIYYRADGDSRWLLLKDGLSERNYAFDAGLLPDGGYTVRVVASDAPSNAPGQALSGWKESPYFEIDTTPPVISKLNATLKGNRLRVSFTASDSFSVVQRAEYSIDAGRWQFVAPVGEIADLRTANYDFEVPLPAESTPSGGVPSFGENPGPGEHVVVVRVYDRAENMAVAKAVVR